MLDAAADRMRADWRSRPSHDARDPARSLSDSAYRQAGVSNCLTQLVLCPHVNGGMDGCSTASKVSVKALQTQKARS